MVKVKIKVKKVIVVRGLKSMFVVVTLLTLLTLIFTFMAMLENELPKVFRYGNTLMNELEYKEWLLTVMPAELVENLIKDFKRKFPELFTNGL